MKIWCRRFRIFLFLILAGLIYLFSGSSEKYIEIDDYTLPISINGTNETFYDITQEFPAVTIENVESILGKIFQKIRYNKICFRDEGSSISERDIGSRLKISVTYSDQTEIVRDDSDYENYLNNESCHDIENFRKISWKWKFESPDEFTNSWLRIDNSVIEPKLSVYLKTSNWYIFIFALLLCLFYSGIFWWACTRIWAFLEKGN